MYKSGFKTWFLIPLVVLVGVAIFALLKFLSSDNGQIANSQINTSATQNQQVEALQSASSLNTPLPIFNLPNIDEPNQILSNSDLPNEPFLLNVWGSWCTTCAVEHPYLMQLARSDVPIVGVNFGDTPDEATAYLNEHGNPFELSMHDEAGELVDALGVVGAPETFLIDTDGTIRQHLVGELSSEVWQTQFEPCFSELQVADKAIVTDVCD